MRSDDTNVARFPISSQRALREALAQHRGGRAAMMKLAELDELQAIVAGIIEASPLAARFRSLTLESDGYDREDDFLRIQVFMTDPDSMADDEVASLVSSIEEAITVRDDRFPSVRFPYS